LRGARKAIGKDDSWEKGGEIKDIENFIVVKGGMGSGEQQWFENILVSPGIN
jgi:hypothetical protein